MLELQHVSRCYDTGETRVVALDDVSLTIGAAEFIAIAGPSGSGKSTLLQIVGLLDRPTAGAVLLDGHDLSALSDAEQTRLRLETLGFVFQRFHLLHDLTALENVELPMEAAGVPPDERRERASALLKAVGLGDRTEFRPSRLSGGQRQRVAIARALANDPRIILADEPTGELHSEDKARVIELFCQLHAEGRAIVMVTHDKDVAAVAERQIEIRDGHVTDVIGQSALPPPDAVRPHPTILLPDGSPCPVRPAGAVEVVGTVSPPIVAAAVSSAATAPPHRRRRSRWPLMVLGAVVLLAAVASGFALLGGFGRLTQPSGPADQVVTPERIGRGEIRPESEAIVRALNGGVVTRLSVDVGATVVENQEIARVRAPDGTMSVVTAPWNGTVTNLPIHNGDSVTVGAVIAAVGDVSRLRVETDDVDEFMVASIHPGQDVTITVDALEGRVLRGRVRTVALRSQETEDGDDQYPVVVDLDWTPPELRAGMTVRVDFSED
jgi:ABC-type lipoprotein export system ATPase subunit/biotin carboxyl carrier protein